MKILLKKRFVGLVNSALDLGFDVNARRVCYPNVHLVLAIGKNLERNFVTNSSHEVIDPGDRELSNAFALSFKEKRE